MPYLNYNPNIHLPLGGPATSFSVPSVDCGLLERGRGNKKKAVHDGGWRACSMTATISLRALSVERDMGSVRGVLLIVYGR